MTAPDPGPVSGSGEGPHVNQAVPGPARGPGTAVSGSGGGPLRTVGHAPRHRAEGRRGPEPRPVVAARPAGKDPAGRPTVR